MSRIAPGDADMLGPRQSGRTADRPHATVSLLVNLVGGGDVTTDELFFEPELVVRGSTGAVRANS